MLTIDRILHVSFPAVLAHLRPAGGVFVSSLLNDKLVDGSIELSTDMGGYPLETISVPLGWNAGDDAANDERGRVTLASLLLTNGINAHDDVMMKRLVRGYVLPNAIYELGPTCEVGGGMFICQLSTVIAVKAQA